MPKMKWGDAEPDWGKLDDAEYSEGGDFPRYDGPIPPKNSLLSGAIKKIWVVETQAGDSMFKVLWEAEGNTGAKEKYNGLTIWDNVLWLPQVKFRWQPWLDALGITLRDVRGKTVTAEDDDNVGTPVVRIGKLKLPAGVRIVTDRETYNEEVRAKVAEYLLASDAEDEDDDLEDDEDGSEVPF